MHSRPLPRQRASLGGLRRVPIAFSLVSLLAMGGVAFGVNPAPPAPAVAPAWPASTSLVISEVQTGGASAADEFVELYCAGPSACDLTGTELAYVSSAGTSATRRAAWTSGTAVDPGRHVLVANASGSYASVADLTYTSGLAAAGGAVILRPTGGAPFDAVGWGDATNPFVETRAVPAPPAGSSIERRPGGLLGNGIDTNDNWADFVLSDEPTPQGLAAPPVPAPVPTPGPSLHPSPTPQPDQSPLPSVPADSPPPSPGGPETPAPQPSPGVPAAPPSAPPAEPSELPSPIPGPTATPSPTPAPTPTPTPGTPPPTPAPTPIPLDASPRTSVADARALSDGTPVIVAGVLTTAPGFTETGHLAFIQDATAGIGAYLTSAAWPPCGRGDGLVLRGIVETRYAQRIVRVADTADVAVVSGLAVPTPIAAPTGQAREALEGSLLAVSGRTVGGIADLSDGFSFDVDDGSGSLRVVAVASSGIAAGGVPAGALVALVGVLGQRDSSGTGSAAYRLYLRDPADLLLLPDPTPAPSSPTPSDVPPSASPAASSSPEPDPGTSPAVTPTPTPTAAPSASPPAVVSVASVRTASRGASVRVAAIVTAEPGRTIGPRYAVVQDATGGIAVRLAPGQESLALTRGTRISVSGRIADVRGNREVRVVDAASLVVEGTATPPLPQDVSARSLGEPVEGLLVRIEGRIAGLRRSGGNLVGLNVMTSDGRAAVVALAAAHVSPAGIAVGRGVQVVGIVGQSETASGRLDGYRVWLRDRRDLVLLSGSGGAAPSPSPSPAAVDPSTGPDDAGDAVPASPEPSPSASCVLIARIRSTSGVTVTTEGVVTVRPGILDASGRRIVIEDATGGILVRLPADGALLAAGDRLRVSGVVGTYLGAVQLGSVDAPLVVGHGATRSPRALSGSPSDADEERLVRVSGRVESVRRQGSTWRAEIRMVSGAGVPVQGLARAGIPSTTLVVGRQVTITGVVRRPSPSASDQRLSIVPRAASDVALGPAVASADAAGERTASAITLAEPPPGATSAGAATGPGTGTGSAESGADQPVADVDLSGLGEYVGRSVRVGGLVGAVDGERIRIDDGSAAASVRLDGAGSSLASLVEVGQAVNLVGTVEIDASGATGLVVHDVAALARVGLLGETIPIAAGGVRASVSDGVAGGGDAWQSTSSEDSTSAGTGLEAGSSAQAGAPVAGPFGLPSGALLGALLVAAGLTAGVGRWLRDRPRLEQAFAPPGPGHLPGSDERPGP